MEYRFFRDPDSGLPHCRKHGVIEREAIEVVDRPAERFRRRDGTIVAQGQTVAGRYLRVICREHSDHVFVITAYDLRGKAKQAYRRRRRRRNR